MNQPGLSLRAPVRQVQQARRQWLDRGTVDRDLIDASLLHSWQRSRAFGLAPAGHTLGAPHASAAQLVRALERQRDLVAHAQPVMEHLFEHTRDAGSMVVLADGCGLLLQTVGDAGFLERAQRVALRAGANWHEQWRGTNAIGTALADAAAAVVHASEHYLERNGFLTCAAAPIVDCSGRVLGVIDVTGDHRGYHRHTLALVRSAARMIEHQLFLTRHASQLRLRLHPQREGVGSLFEGLVACSPDGRVLGADAAALAMLQRSREQTMGASIDALLQLDLDTVQAWAARPAGGAPHPVRRLDGGALWLRVEGGCAVVTLPAAQRSRTVQPAAGAQPHAGADALAALDTGDPAMQGAVARARRVLDKPIALLLHGETGTGKEVFARAVHASGARRSAPFVAVNCAALPEGLIEAELFGYRPGAYTGAGRDGAPGRIREAHGGTLFLDEIGDMPLAAQASLLRVLQDRQVVPLGGGKTVPVDFRLICATHRDLRAAIEAGSFREDLYYRLAGLTLTLPPLRERHDFRALVAHTLATLEPTRELHIEAGLADALQRHSWPGNLRQLHTVLHTACALLDEHEVCIDWLHIADDLATELRPAPPVPEAPASGDLRALAARTIRDTVSASAGNLSDAARRLGISRNTLYRKLERLSLR